MPGAKRLFDLIQTKDQYRNVFYKVLGDTLVVPTVKDANKVAWSGNIKRRVVSL